jgi:hypothetical protein
MAQRSPSELEHRKAQSKQILTYGCLPLVALIFIIAIVSSLTDDDKADAKSPDAESSAQAPEHTQTPEELQEQLKRELASFKKPSTMQAIAEDNTVEQLQMRLIVYNLWATMVAKADGSASSETTTLGKELRDNVAKRQRKDFPGLRKRYVEVIASKLWENDIDVTVSGKRNEYINFTAGMFATNKNIKDVQGTLSSILQQFRFKQARYRWYKGDDDYTLFTLESEADDKVTTISWGE